MNGLNDAEKKGLLSVTKKIYENKLVQIIGFKNLVDKAKNERLKDFILKVYEQEKKRAEFWSKRREELQGKRMAEKDRLGGWKTRVILDILGIKGIFEWAVTGEERAILDLTIQASKIRDLGASEEWIRYASEEKIHLERIKTVILGMEEWEIRGGVKEIISGAFSGLVSTLAFLAGIVGVITNPSTVLLSGVAELFAGTLAMAAGAYQSSKSEMEVWERKRESKKIKEESVEDKLIKVYETRFYPGVHTDILEELGLAPKEFGNPIYSGILSGVSFGIAALVPILPFTLSSLSGQSALITSIIATIAALFGVGAMKTIFSRKNWLRSGLEMMIIGAAATTVTYIIGKLFSLIVK